MAETKKSDTASDDTKRSEEDVVAEPQTSEDETVSHGATDAQIEEADGVEDAEILDDVPSEDETGERVDGDEDSTVAPDLGTTEPDTPPTAPDEVIAGAEDLSALDDSSVYEEDVADLETLDGVPGNADDTPETVSEPAAEETSPEPQPVPAPVAPPKETVVVEKRSGFGSGFLGGLVAALGVAFAVPYIIPENMLPWGQDGELSEQVASQTETIATLQTDLQALRGQLAEAASSSNLAALQSETGAALDELRASLEATASLDSRLTAVEGFAGRLDALEKRPIADAPDPASVAAVEAYGREFAALKAAVEAQMSDVEALVAETKAAAEAAVTKAAEDSTAAQEKAEAEAAAAAEKAERAARAQALVDIQAALESGAGFTDSLPRLDGIDVPAALTANAADGVPTLPELLAAFPPAARDALDASLRANSGSGVEDRTKTFLRTQLGIRSLAPKEGDDPDAILSRAEAAVAEGRLRDAVAELSALPEDGQTHMADWIALATTRADAVAAADELAASLAAN
ncbi:hypothetical protein CLV78_112114 [Aliiruegeria haliotis]|uniref:Inner membrane protein n=1 Tax=Aliiruegeria haliotis TaxID=1280846 RepID=A0A2T0RI16_9RHOB|nr:hypothetical protein [Aliiruegeria haliotis]PRY20740.1 hypothetical protein CLV78_112114 [Aliiruegeria haliotis]